MTSANNGLLTRLSFDAGKLMADFPPKFRHRNKQAVFRLACPDGCTIGGTVIYTRWKAMALPNELDLSQPPVVESRQDVYDYSAINANGPAVEWHVNFADPHLFMAYGTSLLAQDEMQVLEHPVLGSLLEALYASGNEPLTVEDRMPTPVLVRGAERRVCVATEANFTAGRPEGLYGNRFAVARVEVVERATTPINPPTITNLIAMAAPSGSHGKYRWTEVNDIMTTAFTGFCAARMESAEAVGDDAICMIHTGFWGCGAFGGNRVLMALLQLLAAQLAGINRLIFHTYDSAGTESMVAARAFLANLVGARQAVGLDDIIDGVVGVEFRWGVSDGN